MKRFFISILLLIQVLVVTAQTGSIRGTVTDAKTKEALIGTTVLIKGTTQGTITDFDGNYVIPNVEAGSHTIAISFISYDTQEFQVEVQSGNEVELNVELLPATLEIEGVQVVAKAKRESEAMLLIDQKNASGIKESIGSKRMSSLGVSDAASATSKITGVTKNEGSGDIYIRGLGDRYLTTTMNGLPIPSDDVEKKNIDLNLFSTDIIGNVGINKTFAVETYGDQTSGAVNIGSKTYSEDIELEVSTGTSTNIIKDGIFGNFKATQNSNDVNVIGSYSLPYNTIDAIRYQSWNTEEQKFPLNRGLSFMGGKKFKLFDNEFSVFATLSHSNDFEYQNGIYKKYRMNSLNNSFTDAESFSTVFNTTGMLNLVYDFSDGHSLSFYSMLIYKTKDELYEQGRNGEGYVRDQDPQEEGAFVRDQNLKETQLYINQLLGSHKLGDNNQLNWAVGYNFVNAEEPNRIRNEVSILDENTVQFAHVGDYQQRKSLQNIEDSEISAYLKDEVKLVDEETKKLRLNIGGNFRNKQRDFNSLFVGVRAKGVQVKSIDNLDEALLNRDLYDNGELIIREGTPDLYNAQLDVYAGYVDASFEVEKLSGAVGVRYEYDQIDVDWDVTNYVGRLGSISNQYNNILPALNLKYQLTEKSSLRLAASKTVTLPEFKELAPFEYVSPTGRVTKGNPNLKNSDNYNVDLKWEIFPGRKELVSVTGFYKMINDPINLAQTRGSSGNFIFENTGDKANVYGVEFETRLGLIKATEEGMSDLELVVNGTKMWFNQDLLEEFQYNNKTEADLQGAAGFIGNLALTYSNNKEKEFVATLTSNYSSDKIFALGAPEDFANSATLFNEEIVEKGFATVDLIVSKKLTDKISLKFSGKNLLNPEIKQTQEITPTSTGVTTTEVVNSYKKGINLSLSLKINLH
ncbi:TonB-dependent receptor domain-containing protein [uncultured Draconibacterium sp.]|uniref:TonB-dependent receptor n=1 Tax=uncultured Draconibacterium sp. TaxID=1573823 RepID=UPI002AA80906|nr:TonB-dependent receptor [uncultured Draconibacterium sp.]